MVVSGSRGCRDPQRRGPEEPEADLGEPVAHPEGEAAAARATSARSSGNVCHLVCHPMPLPSIFYKPVIAGLKIFAHFKNYLRSQV